MSSEITEFSIGDIVVYPAHGAGKIIDIAKKEAVGIIVEVYVIQTFSANMLLNIPIKQAINNGLRHLSSQEIIQNVVKKLQGKAERVQGFWNKRVYKYETKIKSGDLVAIAEVARALFKTSGQNSQSYSERIIYENAIDRIAIEIAAIQKINKEDAVHYVLGLLSGVEQ
jgi:CarD family transcriptional regulator